MFLDIPTYPSSHTHALEHAHTSILEYHMQPKHNHFILKIGQRKVLSRGSVEILVEVLWVTSYNPAKPDLNDKSNASTHQHTQCVWLIMVIQRTKHCVGHGNATIRSALKKGHLLSCRRGQLTNSLHQQHLQDPPSFSLEAMLFLGNPPRQ